MPPNETERQAALDEYRLLDSEPEPVLDGIARAAAEICGTPIALISLIDRDRQWFKSRHGLKDVTETPRELAFCAHTILGEEPLDVPDAHEDARFAGNPMVRDGPRLRFYHGVPLRNAEGHALGTLCVIDREPRALAAGQKLALQALAQAAVHQFEQRRRNLTASRLQAFLDQSPNQVIAFDCRDYRIVYANAAALRVLGLTPVQGSQILEQMRFFDVKPWRSEAQWRDELAALCRGELEQINFEATDRDAAGRVFPVDVRMLHFRDAGGGDVFFAIAHDISAEKAARDDAAAAAQRWQMALDNAGQGLWDWDIARGTVFYSQTWKTMLGYAAGEIGDGIGEWDRRVHDDDRDEVNAALQAHFRGETDFYRSEHRMRARDGGWRWILDRGRIIARDDAGRPLRMIGTHTDVTYRKVLEEQLALANRELEQAGRERAAELRAARRDIELFAASVSHDLRAPLRAISGFSGILQEDYATGCPPEVGQLLGRIRHNADRLGGMIDSLRKLARDANRSIERRTVDMNALAREVLAEFEEERARRGVTVTLGELPPCQADPDLLRHVLLNLIANAFKFTREKAHPEVEIGWHPDGLAEGYYVRDNGAGFDMARAGELFHPWRRLHPESRFEGTGIGLSTCARIVDRHGGRIWAEAAPDAGATFFFTVS
jgi:PAS domain S-box-containing protein